MSQQPQIYDPVTDIKIVSQKDKCPPGFFVLEKTVTGHDGQLYDATWRHKGKRFLCFSRQGQNALVDLRVQEDGDPVPTGFSAITTTADDGEKGLRKHVLCFKMQPRNDVQQAVHDFVLIDRTKGENAPHGYFSMSNEVNDITICFRIAPCMKFQPPPAQPTPAGGYPGYQNHYSGAPHAVGPNRQQWSSQHQVVPPVGQPWPQQQHPGHQLPPQEAQTVQSGQHYAPHHAMPATKPEAYSAIEGLPFQVNSKFEILWKKSGPTIPAIQNLSVEDVESKFNYDFSKEQRVVSRS